MAEEPGAFLFFQTGGQDYFFEEYSMVDPKNLGPYFGFTREEVQEGCRKHGVDYGEAERRYDGYQPGEIHIYNPKSVVDAWTWGKVKSYWTGTKTYYLNPVMELPSGSGLADVVYLPR